MSKFNIGDRVRIAPTANIPARARGFGIAVGVETQITRVTSMHGETYEIAADCGTLDWFDHELDPVPAKSSSPTVDGRTSLAALMKMGLVLAVTYEPPLGDLFNFTVSLKLPGDKDVQYSLEEFNRLYRLPDPAYRQDNG